MVYARGDGVRLVQSGRRWLAWGCLYNLQYAIFDILPQRNGCSFIACKTVKLLRQKYTIGSVKHDY